MAHGVGVPSSEKFINRHAYLPQMPGRDAHHQLHWPAERDQVVMSIQVFFFCNLPTGWSDFATTLPELLVSIGSNR